MSTNVPDSDDSPIWCKRAGSMVVAGVVNPDFETESGATGQ